LRWTSSQDIPEYRPGKGTVGFLLGDRTAVAIQCRSEKARVKNRPVGGGGHCRKGENRA